MATLPSKEQILEKHRKHLLTITDYDAIKDAMDEYADAKVAEYAASRVQGLVDALEKLNAAVDKMWNECDTKSIPDNYKKEIAAAQSLNCTALQSWNQKEGGVKQFEGSVFKHPTNNITIGCISPEARGLLDEIMKLWEVHYNQLKEDNKARNVEYEPSYYSFAYWLVRWSNLIQPAATTDKEKLVRLTAAMAEEVSKDAETAEAYLKSEGVDVAKLNEDARYITWKAELIKLVSEASGESTIKINDAEAKKWYDSGASPYQTFRETWNME